MKRKNIITQEVELCLWHANIVAVSLIQIELKNMKMHVEILKNSVETFLFIVFLLLIIAKKVKYFGAFGKKVGGGQPVKSKPEKKLAPKWRQEHQELINGIRSAR